MNEIIRREEEDATTRMVGNGLNIDQVVEAGALARHGGVDADFDVTVPDPLGEERPLRVRRLFAHDQLGHGCEQAFLADKEHVRDG